MIAARAMGCVLLAWLACLAIGGCAPVVLADRDADHAAKSFVVRPGRANIYVYRTDSLGSAVRMEVLIDGIPLGGTGKKTFVMMEVRPGRHTITSRAERDTSLDIVTRPGQSYFVRQDAKRGIRKARSQLVLVDEDVGRKGVKKCELVE